MKKLLVFILALVYLFAAMPAVCSWSNCEGDCEELYVGAEDHQGASASYVKLLPMAPALNGERYFETSVSEVSGYSFYEAPLIAGAVPLFVRYCHFRI